MNRSGDGRGRGRGEELAGKEVDRCIVEAISFVAVEVTLGCVWEGVQGRFAGESSSVKCWME